MILSVVSLVFGCVPQRPSLCSFLCKLCSVAVFAPTNDAFAKLPGGALTYLLDEANRDTLTDILTYHVAAGKALSTSLSNGQSVTTVQGESVQIRIGHLWSWRHMWWVQAVFVNDARVITADVEASNGVIHVINEVLIPPSATLPQDILGAAESAGLNSLVAAVKVANLEGALSGSGPFTVFAPSEEAFAKLDPAQVNFLLRNPDILAEVLLFHVLDVEVFAGDIPSGGVTVTTLGGLDLTASPSGGTVLLESTDGSTSASVVAADVDVLNGVVHVIDSVLIPPGLSFPGDIATLASSSPDLSVLVSALQDADLVEALQGPGPFTVFAPTNAAFQEALGDGPTPAILADVLKFHVVNSYLDSEAIVGHAPVLARTLTGQFVALTVSDDGAVFSNDAQVTTPDVVALNGVVHIIDKVMIPPAQCHWPQWVCNLEAMVSRRGS